MKPKRIYFYVLAVLWVIGYIPMSAGADKMPLEQADSTKLIFKDARGLGIKLKDIRNAALAKSHEFLVVFVFAGEDEEYVDMVSGVTTRQHHHGKKKIYVLFYDRPTHFEGGALALVYKGEMSLPLTQRSDPVGAGLSTLIRRAYSDHYKD